MTRLAVCLVALAAAGCTTVSPSPTGSASPSVSASASVTASASTPATSTAGNEALLGLLRGLGIHASVLGPWRPVEDPRAVLTDADVLDGSGRRLGTVTIDTETGRLWALTLYGPAPESPGPTLPPVQVPSTAHAILSRAGIEVGDATPVVSWDEGMQAWQAEWGRTIGGYRVACDSVRVWIHPNGDLEGLSNLEYPTAPMPATLIGAVRAKAAVLAYLTRGGTGEQATIGEPTLQWDLPNDMADPSAPHLAPGVARLVYSVTWKLPSNSEAQGFLEVDAGSAWIIAGGNVS